VLAGPSCGQFLAELGAEVVKVENPKVGGDVTRNWYLNENDSEPSSYFQSCNFGKKSITLDISPSSSSSESKDREILQKLVKKADIVISSYKPGDAEKLGVDFNTFSALNPRLVYGQITGYGLDDKRPGYDTAIQAEVYYSFSFLTSYD